MAGLTVVYPSYLLVCVNVVRVVTVEVGVVTVEVGVEVGVLIPLCVDCEVGVFILLCVDCEVAEVLDGGGTFVVRVVTVGGSEDEGYEDVIVSCCAKNFM